MSNSEKFKKTFEQVTISEECLNEIKDRNFGSKKHPVLKYAAAIAAVFVVVVLTGNGMYYAENGTSVIEDIPAIEDIVEQYFHIKNADVVFNNDEVIYNEENTETIGEITEAYTAEYYIAEDGSYHYDWVDENGEVTSSIISYGIKDPDHTSEIVYFYNNEDGDGGGGGIITFVNELTEIDGRIYLDVEEGVDITEDFQDGVATGTFYDTVNEQEKLFEYRVEGTLEKYTVKIKWVGEE